MRLRRRSPVRSMRAPDLLARMPWHTFAGAVLILFLARKSVSDVPSAGPCRRLRCGAACRHCRCADLSIRGPRPSRSGCSRLCSAHPRRTCTPPIMWHFHSRWMHRLGCCMQPAVMESTDGPLAIASASSCFHSLLLLQCPPNRPVLLTHHRPHVRDSAAETVLAPLRW